MGKPYIMRKGVSLLEDLKDGLGARGADLMARNYWYVDSRNGSAGNDGASWDHALATLDAAVGKCSAYGDVIFVLPGHAETIVADSGVDIDVAGVKVIGLGSGSVRPTFTFTTAVTADFKLAAAGVYIENLLFLGGIDATTGVIEVSAADCSIVNCEYRDVTGQATDVITTTADADRLRIKGLRFFGAAAAGANSAIALVGMDDPEISDCYIYGNFAVGAIDCRTTAVVRLNIHDCKIWTANAADIGIVDTVTGSTGWIGPNLEIMLTDDAANVTEAVTGATFHLVDPVYVVNAVNQKALLINWTAVADS
jgi:hypothetical protein